MKKNLITLQRVKLLKKEIKFTLNRGKNTFFYSRCFSNKTNSKMATINSILTKPIVKWLPSIHDSDSVGFGSESLFATMFVILSE